MNYDIVKLRKYALWGAICLVVVLSLFWLFHYLNTGTIAVTASGSQDIVTIAGVNDGTHSRNAYYKQATNHLSVRVPVGEYIISAQGHVSTTNKTVVLRARQKLTFTLKPAPVTPPVAVTGTNAVDISASDTQLSYINPDTPNPGLYKIDSQNNVTNIAPGVAFQSVKWANANYGIGQDDNGNLDVINNGGVTQLKTPAAFSANQRAVYAVTPTRQIYLSIGPDIYFGNDSGNFQKIYTVAGAPAQLFPAPGFVGVLGFPKRSAQGTDMTIITPGGKLVRKGSIGGIISGGVWSPDGKKLVISTLEGAGLEIFNSSLERIASLPNGSDGYAWLDSNILLYSSGNTLLSYHVNTEGSVLIANLPPGNSINEVSLDSSKHYVYLAVQSSTGGTELDRVGLSGQKAPDIAYQLDVFFPKSVGGCSINYVNFTAPTLAVTAPDAAATCQQLVESEIANDNLNSNLLQINYISTGSGE